MKRLAFAAVLAVAGASQAQEVSLESVGGRFGFTDSNHARDFQQAEAFGNLNLPWRWNLGSRFYAQTRADFSAGWLGDLGENGFIATAGPSVLLGRENFPLSLEGGISPTVLSRDEFPEKSFGSWFQFTSHLGLNLDYNEHLRFLCRFQHMSNAGIAHPNPGLNLLMLGMGYRF